ncbi:c-type cytochrome [Salsuginibacillus kocurii]|uniref:c-type cytochrome n=1 Tax=Salsuginibacillus kocurii TaxID=427078 RepID=UPI00037DA7A2|nr:cytochrome c [Salsuginibacillus kocurii]
MQAKPLIPFFLIAVIGLVLMLSLSFVGLNQQVDPDEEENGEENGEDTEEIDDPIELGEQVYEENCLSCHGDNLEGASGPGIEGYDHDGTIEAIEEGPGSMPDGLVDGEEAEAVAEYVENYE